MHDNSNLTLEELTENNCYATIGGNISLYFYRKNLNLVMVNKILLYLVNT